MRRRKGGLRVAGVDTVRITADQEDRGKQIREDPQRYFAAARLRARKQVDSELRQEGLADR